eukprot:gene29721-33555_t
MAIDGWVARTRKPYWTETQNVMAFRNRHDCWGMVVLAGCDSNCRYSMFSCIATGSTNDSLIWDMCNMKHIIETERRLPDRFYIIGDEAFINTNQLLTPYSGNGLGVWKDSFNYHLSAMRQCIERSFALLTGRWGILWRPLRCAMARWPLVLTVCAKLHNYCLDKNVSPCTNRFYEDVEEEDEDIVLLNTETSEEENAHRRGGDQGARRKNFTEDLQNKGIRRPAHSQINSRS